MVAGWSGSAVMVIRRPLLVARHSLKSYPMAALAVMEAKLLASRSKDTLTEVSVVVPSLTVPLPRV